MVKFSLIFITRKQPTDKFEKKEIEIIVKDEDVEPDESKRGYAIFKAHEILKKENYELRLPMNFSETKIPA